MAYLVTGATGFIGRFFIPELLKRQGDIHVLIRPGIDSEDRYAACAREWGAGDRVRPVRGDLGQPKLGIDASWLAEHRGSIEHVVHLAVGFDAVEPGGGTRNVVAAAEDLKAGLLHHVSTVEVAGKKCEGLFTEEMFEVGQVLPTPVLQAKFDAEKIVRESTLPWRIYRPSIVIGHSETGEMDRIDGPYYFFRSLRMAAQLPRLLPVIAPKLGETNMVPVDYVARALDHIAHHPGAHSTTYHLVDPRRFRAAEALNLFADEAGAPHLVEVMPKPTLAMTLRVPGANWLLPRVGVPLEVLEHSEFSCRFDCRNTTEALAGTDIKVPPLDAYAARIWKYWIENWV
ncbi:SDR family oxidoreductase [Nocardia sp. XZ_19_385]|uniref:SDR family oxidoreductase n=1 Tax=Nocardia sp. XZ_19_385 TaxID=2769488 RepID=UPI00188F5A30|nr:SDR family oxidoreductase [Nocardia sp. XZ_19_385]